MILYTLTKVIRTDSRRLMENFFLYRDDLRSMEFVLGALGASGAVCFTNPLEVIKTRFQLQGELQKAGNYKVHYRNFAHAIYVVAKNEGPLALQKGLFPAMGHQVFLNGTRLGIFDLAQKNKWLLKEDGTVSLTKSALVGAGAGTLGGFLASPLGMVSTCSTYLPS